MLEGLAGYPKMSKSIPESSIHLGMSADLLAARILTDESASQPPLLSAIELASGWKETDLDVARIAYHRPRNRPPCMAAAQMALPRHLRQLRRPVAHSAP